LTAFTLGIAGCLELTIIPAIAIETKFDQPASRLDNARPAYASHATRCAHPRRNPGLEPAYGIRLLGQGIRESPGLTTSIPFATCRALGGIARPGDRRRVISTRAVKPHLPGG